jgi:hypothetical protein
MTSANWRASSGQAHLSEQYPNGDSNPRRQHVKSAPAANLIQAQLPEYQGGDIVFTQIGDDTFVYDNDGEMRAIFVSSHSCWRRRHSPRGQLDRW